MDPLPTGNTQGWKILEKWLVFEGGLNRVWFGWVEIFWTDAIFNIKSSM
jgi:hypothetical protein